MESENPIWEREIVIMWLKARWGNVILIKEGWKILVLWQIRTSQHSPAPTALFFFFFHFLFHDFTWARDLFHEAAKRMQNGKGKGPHQQCYILFCKRHRNSLRIWPGNPVNASGDIKRTLRFSELAWQGPVGPHSICRFVTLAFCHFKWLHIILYLHVPWLFHFTVFQLSYSLDF